MKTIGIDWRDRTRVDYTVLSKNTAAPPVDEFADSGIRCDGDTQGNTN